MPQMTIYTILFIIVSLLMPAMAILNSKTITDVLVNKPELKKGIYFQGILIQWMLCLFIISSMWFYGDEFHIIGLNFIHTTHWVTLFVVAPIISYLYFSYAKPSAITRRIILKIYNHVSHYLPKTTEQYRWGVALSFTAGFCEELIYRGFIFWQLKLFLNFWPAVLLTNIIFALTHYGTGWKNAMGAFVFGMIFSGLYLYTGNLWLSITCHIIIDLIAMTLYPKVFIQEKKQSMQ